MSAPPAAKLPGPMARGAAFALAQRSAHPRAPARGPGLGRAGLAQGSARGLPPRRRGLQCGLRRCPPPRAAARVRPAAHLTLCRAPSRGHGGVTAPRPADFLRSGARETTARELPAAPGGGQGLRRGAAAPGRPESKPRTGSRRAEEDRQPWRRPPPPTPAPSKFLPAGSPVASVQRS